jgi:hypothetical protein
MHTYIWTTCGPEYFTKVNIDGVKRNTVGQIALFVKALYGLKSSGQAWHGFLAIILREWNSYHQGLIQMFGTGSVRKLTSLSI